MPCIRYSRPERITVWPGSIRPKDGIGMDVGDGGVAIAADMRHAFRIFSLFLESREKKI